MANPTCGQISARLIRLRKKPEMALFLRTVNLDLTRFLKFNRRNLQDSAPVERDGRAQPCALFYGSLSGEAYLSGQSFK
jgi:hypothetical protein